GRNLPISPLAFQAYPTARQLKIGRKIVRQINSSHPPNRSRVIACRMISGSQKTSAATTRYFRKLRMRLLFKAAFAFENGQASEAQEELAYISYRWLPDVRQYKFGFQTVRSF